MASANKYISQENLAYLLANLKDKLYNKEEIITLLNEAATEQLSEPEIDAMFEGWDNVITIPTSKLIIAEDEESAKVLSTANPTSLVFYPEST